MCNPAKFLSVMGFSVLLGGVGSAAASSFDSCLASHKAASAAGSVRIELHARTTAVTLHWPTAHTLALAAWLQAMTR